MARARSWLGALWHGLLRWSGDDAYARYLSEHREHGHALLGRREFYRQYFNRRGGGTRCC